MLDILGRDQDARRERRSGRFKRKKNLAPAAASDEDLDPFEKRPSRAGKSGRSKRVDPFANANSASTSRSGAGTRKKERADPFAAKSGTTSGAKRDPFSSAGKSKSKAKERGRSGRTKRRGNGGSDDPGGYGLVLSRISDEAKRKLAARLIADIQGSSLDEALKLTERTIIPVLKGVSKEAAERHLEQFKLKRISGRVTKRRS
jgi:hypothetical protein